MPRAKPLDPDDEWAQHHARARAIEFSLTQESRNKIKKALGAQKLLTPNDIEKLGPFLLPENEAEMQDPLLILEKWIKLYRYTLKMAGEKNTPKMTIAAIDKLLTAKNRFVKQRPKARTCFIKELKRIVHPGSRMFFGTILALGPYVDECLKAVDQPSIQEVMDRLENAAVQEKKKLENLPQLQSRIQALKFQIQGLEKFFRIYARPEQDNVYPDDSRLHEFICTFFKAAEVSFDSYIRNPSRLTKLLTDLPATD